MPDGTVPAAEDYDDTRAVIRLLPESKGCHVLEAVNAKEDVEYAA